LILRRIVKIVTTKCQIVRLKCTKIDFGWGSAPDPAEGAYSDPPDPISAFKGPTSKARAKSGKGRRGGVGTEERKEEKGKEREGGKEGDPVCIFKFSLE